MKSLNILSLLVAGLCFDSAFASPTRGYSTSKVSPDATCGGKKGYTCLNSSFGSCCSQYGWCGSTKAYCGTGCQNGFGSCKASNPNYKPKPEEYPFSNKISKDGTCGSNGKGSTCLKSAFGDCCSQYGYCGSSSDYCGKGCQAGFGNCKDKKPNNPKPNGPKPNEPKPNGPKPYTPKPNSPKPNKPKPYAAEPIVPSSKAHSSAYAVQQSTRARTSTLCSSKAKLTSSAPAYVPQVPSAKYSSIAPAYIAHNPSVKSSSSALIYAAQSSSAHVSTPCSSSVRPTSSAPASTLCSSKAHSSNVRPSPSVVYPASYPAVLPSVSQSSTGSYPVVSSYPVMSYSILNVTSSSAAESSTTSEESYSIPSEVPSATEESSSASSTTSDAGIISTSSSAISTTTEASSSSLSSISFTIEEPSTTSSEISSTSSTPSATPTACPGYPKTGTVQVANRDTGVVLGFIRNTYDNQNSHTFGPLTNALQVKIDFPGPDCTTPTDITLRMLNMQGNSESHPFVGLVGGSGGYNFGAGRLGYAYMAGVALVPANSPPVSVAHSIQDLGYNGPAESSIWSFNPTSGLLTMEWTNSDGTQNNAVSFYDASVDFLGAVGDLANFQATFPGENAIAVDLTFVEQILPVKRS